MQLAEPHGSMTISKSKTTVFAATDVVGSACVDELLKHLGVNVQVLARKNCP